MQHDLLRKLGQLVVKLLATVDVARDSSPPRALHVILPTEDESASPHLAEHGCLVLVQEVLKLMNGRIRPV